MPLPDLGKTAGILGGGGAAQGLPEIIQINEFLNAGIKFHYLSGTSVAAWAVLNPKQAYAIYKDNINSEADIWDFDPNVKAVVRGALKNIPHEPFRHPVKFLKFIARALANIPPIPWDLDPSPESFSRLSPFVEKVLTLAKIYGLDEAQGFFDLSPLVKKVRERLDLNEFWKQDTKIHIFARSVETGDLHIFSNKEEDCERGNQFHYIDSEDVAFKAAEAACALRSVFNPIIIGGRPYCDPGTANPFPIGYAFDEGCDTIFAFIKDFNRYTRGKNWFLSKIEDDDVSMRYRYNDIKKLADIRKRQEGQRLEVIHPQYPLHPDLWLLGLSPAAKEYTFPLEHEKTNQWLKENLNIDPA